MKRVLMGLSSYALGHESYTYHVDGQVFASAVFFTACVAAIYYTITRYSWQRR